MPLHAVVLSKEDSEKLDELLKKLFEEARAYGGPAIYESSRYTLWCDRGDVGYRFGGRYYASKKNGK